MSKTPVKLLQPIALVGPTASGKSGLALWLAQKVPLEIISVDSALVYRGMDIGTAKPTAAEQAQVPHHLIDIRHPSQSYSAAEFASDAQRLITDIQSRGRHPLLVGGTMLYLKALLEPLDELPPAQPALREAIEQQAKQQGWPALHAELALVDGPTAQRLSPNDGQRIGRALEVYRTTGRPLSDLHAQQTRGAAPPTMPVFSLEPADRAWLHGRIAQRFDDMLAQGLVAEVMTLMQQPGLHPDLPSMRCVGYRQVWEILRLFLEQKGKYQQAMDQALMERIRETGTAATRQLAKRQLTWLRSMTHRQVVECDAPQVPERLLHAVSQYWPV